MVWDFVGPDEPRYAQVAREMAASEDFVTPRLHGEPWFEKPILYYWMAATAFKVMGVSELAARLPSAVSGLLGCSCRLPGWQALGFHALWTGGFAHPGVLAHVLFLRARGLDRHGADERSNAEPRLHLLCVVW